jgi:hypothetical protein
MADNAKTTTASVIPTMRYNDAEAAIKWLCEAFGFEKHLVVPGEDGTIVCRGPLPVLARGIHDDGN